jgi:hypothetical protein
VKYTNYLYLLLARNVRHAGVGKARVLLRQKMPSSGGVTVVLSIRVQVDRRRGDQVLRLSLVQGAIGQRGETLRQTAISAT